ncbi:dihydroorotate dehydrogenase electron transfer subunit [Fictibacillus aquaticus]|uniref:Dihydroorotate dehydrogenase B (NAD(+)), electron transfer subunit n=1 Tax=Fictibacillus aquaticus TaxID=2021314 RepID=A0A235FDD2_9BACL|nr:dihydroorotate dehydrogenase electron transfer subunit [Fictibacillus aquaticus]OYD58917.1 dihydroorotate dehydrogenase electron transfer subunit [Fictibacillus aquaticus]
MKRLNLNVVSQVMIADNIFELTVEGEGVESMKVPGQFVHVRTGEGFSSLLRRPISICDADTANNRLKMVYRAQGKGTAWLSTRSRGDKIDLLGPLGNGFNQDVVEAGGKALLVGGGIGVPPLYYLGRKLAQKGVAVSFALGFQSSKDAFYIEKFKEIGRVAVATADGTIGKKGFVTDVMDKFTAEQPVVFACGPSPMLRALNHKTEGLNAYYSFEERMGCGVGACFACVCEAATPSGYVKICSDGPVFKKEEVSI